MSNLCYLCHKESDELSYDFICPDCRDYDEPVVKNSPDSDDIEKHINIEELCRKIDQLREAVEFALEEELAADRPNEEVVKLYKVALSGKNSGNDVS